MTNGNNSDDDDSRHDLTRIEDLSEFMHEEDSELEDLFGDFNKESASKASRTSEDVTIGLNLDELEDDAVSDLPPELPETSAQEDYSNEADDISFGSSDVDSSNDNEASEDSLFEFSEDTSETPQESTETEENNDLFFSNDDKPAFDQKEYQENYQEDNQEENQVETETSERQAYTSPPPISTEKFEEVQNFAQNFSYGQIQGGGNPPFSIIIRHLKYESDAEDILTLLREFNLVTDQNTQETQKSLERGSLIIPQISEYSAIILAHKLRRYDLDLEVGLSDEVHPSKSGELNPRGLMKKDSLRQNKIEQYKKDEDDIPSKEIIVSTTATLEGHVIKKYIGVQTSFTIVDEEELERLKFVQKAQRSQTELHHYETDESVTSERAFKDYQNSFELLFTDLCDQLKVKAMKEKANALLGLSYQLTSLPFEKSNNKSSCYQLTCSATLAIVRRE